MKKEEMERIIKKQKEQIIILEEIFRIAPAGYQSLDINGYIIQVNSKEYKTLGYTREEMLGKYMGDFLTDEYREIFIKRFPIFKKNGTISANFDFVHKNGDILTIGIEGRVAYNADGSFKQTHCILKDITKVLDFQKILKENEERMKLILNSVEEGIYGVDKDENCTFVNASFLKMLGYEDSSELIGENMHDKIHHSYVDGSRYLAEDCPMSKAFTLGVRVQVDNEILWRKDGTNFPVEYSSNPQFKDNKIKGAVVSFKDISDRKRFDNKLQYEKNLAQMYLDIVGVMLLALDNNGNVTLINKKGCEILGLNESEILGLNWFDNFIPKSQVEQVKVVFKNVFKKEIELTAHYENLIINSAGEEVIISWYNSVLYDINGEVSGIISSGEDVTEAKKYEKSLIRIGYEDSLTGLYNRRYYEDHLAKYDIPENLPITIAMADINGLKLINDAFGHAAGDKLLISAAEIISASCQDNCLVARIGGDEFIVLMIRTDEEAAETIINEINENSKLINIESIQLSISFGYMTKYHKNEDIQDIYRTAEDLMYREKLLEIPSMRSSAIETILSALYEKDKNSELHSRTVSIISEKLAKAYGMNRQDVAEVKTAGLLHDIGKIIIPLEILNKIGKLTDEEYSTMKQHSEIGFRILNSSQNMREISDIVLNHHERWDGKGYPRGIKARDIPIKSRIISIADAFDAMTSVRTYKDIISKDEAIEEIMRCSGTQFDPDLVDVFVKIGNQLG